jgi:hypothetical protein
VEELETKQEDRVSYSEKENARNGRRSQEITETLGVL